VKSLPTAQKEQKVAGLREIIEQSKGAIVTDYRGLSVADLTDLRKALRGVDGEFHIVKNTLFKLASEGLIKDESFAQYLEGPSAIGFAKSDSVAVAKTLLDFAKTHKTFAVKAGYVEGRTLTDQQVVAFSKLPSKEVLISQMLGSLNAPITGLVGTLNGVLSNFVFTLQAIADKKTAEA
jgi:large subunit ribosomal protein L10